MSIFYKNKKYVEYSFKLEKELEDLVVKNSKTLFGENTVYIDAKKKINAGELGKTIPDGLLFDFSDIDNPKFYLVEVELAHHSFFGHIFPQITKFFGFLRDGNTFQAELIDFLYRSISADEELNAEFKTFIKKQELFKFLKDTIENSSDILIVIDADKKEFEEIKETYTDTWDKYVKLVILKKFEADGESFLLTEPDFELISDEIIDTPTKDNEDEPKKSYTEEFHLDGVKDNVKQTYKRIREEFPDITFNPQRYYISMKAKHHFAFLKLRKSKLNIVVMLPYETVKAEIKSHFTKEPSAGVQRFYNGKCSTIRVEDFKDLDEVVELLKKAKKTDKIKVRK
jgi:predicted transport protein